MALEYLLDSDVIIWQLRGHAPTMSLLLELSEGGEHACSVISVFEVWCGVRPDERHGTLDYLRALSALGISRDVALKAAGYWRDFRGKGITLGKADVLVAATAAVHDLTLVTYNRAHFPMTDLKLYAPMPDIK